MAGDTQITIIGNLTEDPDLRFTPSGHAVANLSFATTPRHFDKTRNEYVDAETMFLRGTLWRDPAENAAESLRKGMRVIVSGRLKARSYETKEGEKRTVVEIEVDEIGPSLRYARATVVRKQGGTGNASGNAPGTGNGGQGEPPPAQDDPWATPGTAYGQGPAY